MMGVGRWRAFQLLVRGTHLRSKLVPVAYLQAGARRRGELLTALLWPEKSTMSNSVIYISMYLLHLPKHPIQKHMRKQFRPRALRAPRHTIHLPRIPPTPGITRSFLFQLSLPLPHRPTPAIRNNTPPRPLSARLDPQILRLEFPFRIRSGQRVPLT